MLPPFLINQKLLPFLAVDLLYAAIRAFATKFFASSLCKHLFEGLCRSKWIRQYPGVAEIPPVGKGNAVLNCAARM